MIDRHGPTWRSSFPSQRWKIWEDKRPEVGGFGHGKYVNMQRCAIAKWHVQKGESWCDLDNRVSLKMFRAEQLIPDMSKRWFYALNLFRPWCTAKTLLPFAWNHYIHFWINLGEAVFSFILSFFFGTLKFTGSLDHTGWIWMKCWFVNHGPENT